MNKETLEKVIGPHIERCRPGDWNHAKRVAYWVEELAGNSEDNSLLLIAAYIHDIGWRDLVGKEKMTFERLLELEPQANENSEKNIREVLAELSIHEKDTRTILRLVSAADEHASSTEDEAIIVDADSLSKLNIDHIREKFEKKEWMGLYEKWKEFFNDRIKTQKAKELYPSLLEKLKQDILKETE